MYSTSTITLPIRIKLNFNNTDVIILNNCQVIRFFIIKHLNKLFCVSYVIPMLRQFLNIKTLALAQ